MIAVLLVRSSGLGPVAISFWRLVLAVVLVAVLRPRPRTAPIPRARTTLLTGGCLALSQATYFGAVNTAGVALGTLIAIGASPLLVALGGRYLLGERLPRRGAASIAVALAGLCLLTTGHGQSGRHPLLGTVLALVSAASYSALTLISRRAGGGAATPGVFGAGLLCLLPFALADGLLPNPGHLAQSAGWLLLLALVPTVLAYRWYFAGLATVPVATASIIGLLEPVTGVLAGVLLLGEHLTAPSATGAILLLAAVALLGTAAE